MLQAPQVGLHDPFEEIGQPAVHGEDVKPALVVHHEDVGLPRVEPLQPRHPHADEEQGAHRPRPCPRREVRYLPVGPHGRQQHGEQRGHDGNHRPHGHGHQVFI